MKVHADGKRLIKIFEEQVTYEVPDYQRPYSWTKSEIEDLFSDIESAMDSNNNHYFGAFVLNIQRKEKEKVIEIIDGQQRLSTIALFFYVLRYIYSLDKFKDKPGIEHRRNKLKEYLEFLNDDGETIDTKLKLGEVNKEFFNLYVVQGWNKSKIEKEQIIQEFKTRGKYDSSKAIKDAFDVIFDKFAEIIERSIDDEDAINKVKKCNDALLNSLEVVEIDVEQDADAFLIFETLNDRGLDLSSIDLIKNRLFKSCSDKTDFAHVKEKWINMVNTLDDTKTIKKYIRHYWNATFNYTTHQSLFKSVRDEASSNGNSYLFSKNLIFDLNKMAYSYDLIINPNSEGLRSKRLVKVLQDMKDLSFDLTHPIILAAFRIYQSNNEELLYKISRLCLNFLVRYITVMKGKPTLIEKEISECAKSISEIDQLLAFFQKYSKDSEFREAMKVLKVKPASSSVFYILTEYERSLHNEHWVAPDRVDVTIEHILPQTINYQLKGTADWSNKFTKEEHEVFVNRLGNLTLLGPKAQGKAGNKRFLEKKAIYQMDTDMKMTQNLIQYSDWTKKNIEERQELIADATLKIFTLDFDGIM